MASINYSGWTTQVGYYIKGAQTADITEAALHVLRDFCEHTGVWTYDLAAITTVVDQAEQYKENGAANSQFFDLAVEEFDIWESRKPASWKYETATLPSTILYNFVDSKFRLYPIPSVASTGGLVVRIAAKPDINSTKHPEFIQNQWADTITRGIAAHMMGNTNKPWANKTMSKIYHDEYMAKRANAAMEKTFGKVKRKMHVRPRLPMLPGSKISNVKRGW
jgi:hypothetical protein